MNKSNISAAAVIVAGGLGKRLGGQIPKQLLEIGGKAMWRHSAETFLNHPQINAVVLVANEEWREHFEKEAFLNGEKLGRIIIAAGGKERWQSVQNGINALPQNISHALIHDAARPFIGAEIITETIKTISQAADPATSCCLVAKPVFDTVKIAKCGFVEGTIERNKVFLAQTPQVAPVALLKELYLKMADFPDFCPTDEASILEKFNVPIKIVEGNTRNDKITTIDDFASVGGKDKLLR